MDPSESGTREFLVYVVGLGLRGLS